MSASLSLSLGARRVVADSSDLPGPALDIPVDADGDGVSTYGDRYAFNYWLELGGDLTTALESAETRGDVIDLSTFFGSKAALLEGPTEDVVALGDSTSEGGEAQAESGGGCATSGTLVAPFGAPHQPGTIVCASEFRSPTGADLDASGGFWCSRAVPGDDGASGVGLLDLGGVPPASMDGAIPLPSPKVSGSPGFQAEALVARQEQEERQFDCPTSQSSASFHAMTTWPEISVPIICATFSTGGVACGTCGPRSLRHFDALAIDAVRDGMPGDFGAKDTLVFPHALGNGDVAIRTLVTGFGADNMCSNMTATEGDPDPVITLSNRKVWGLALGDFNVVGMFGAYYVSQPAGGTIRQIRRIVKQGSTYSDEPFAVLTGLGENSARAIEFDLISGDLFVGEDDENGRIWRVDSSATVRLFGTGFNKPNGIAFLASGVMLVAEDVPGAGLGNVLAVDGWRNTFKRGDANADGVVDIADPIRISDWINGSAPAPGCWDAADADDNGTVQSADADYLLQFLFSGGPAPPAPGPFACGHDQTADLLGCLETETGCEIQ